MFFEKKLKFLDDACLDEKSSQKSENLFKILKIFKGGNKFTKFEHMNFQRKNEEFQGGKKNKTYNFTKNE